MDKKKMVTVINRGPGVTVYTLPELHVERFFSMGEEREIEYEELERLAYTTGGAALLRDNLIIKDMEVLKSLPNISDVEPEYFYTEADVKDLLLNKSLDALLDCLDFAPSAVIDLIQKVALDLPLNDVAKRDAIKEKTGFSIENALMVKNTKSEAEIEAEQNGEKSTTATRRVAASLNEAKSSSGRRVSTQPAEYKVVSKK